MSRVIRTTRTLAAMALALAGGCDGTLRDAEGWGACQLPASGCGGGELCLGGRCTSSEPDASAGWAQRADGFDAASVLPGSALSIDADHGHALTAAFSGTAATPLALGRYRARFPERADGRLQGTLRLDADEPFTGAVTLLTVRTRTGAILVSLSLAEDELHLEAAPGVLQPSAVINGLDTPTFPEVNALLERGRESTLAVEWRQGAYVRIDVNGAMLFERTMDALDAPDAAYVSEISLGVSDYHGAMNGLEVGFLGWELTYPPR